jgi:hypothetical protein
VLWRSRACASVNAAVAEGLAVARDTFGKLNACDAKRLVSLGRRVGGDDVPFR